MSSARRQKKHPVPKTRAPATVCPEATGSRLAILLAVFAVAIFVRIVYLMQFAAHVLYYDVPIIDAAYYDGWARRVAAGHGYGPSPFYLAPLYP